MRILAISHLFPHSGEPRYGIFVARQLQAMAASGADISLLVPVGVPALSSAKWLTEPELPRDWLCEYDGVDARAIRYPMLPGAWFKAWSGMIAQRRIGPVAQQLHRHKPFDIIYGTNLFHGGDLAVRIGKQLGIPATCLAIGSDVNRDPHASVALKSHYTNIVQSLSAVLTCGDSISRKVDALRNDASLSVYGVVDLDVFKPSGSPSDLRAQLNLDADATVLLYVGYLRKSKGLLELIQAFHSVRQQHRNAQLVLCGEGEDERELKAVAAESENADAIQFRGAIAPDDVHRYMQASDLFVLPSYDEGMPNAVMEAMACGLPVVATSVGGLPDALHDCEGAVLVPPRNAVALADSVLEVLQSPQRLATMRSAAREKAADRFGALPNAKRILSFLEQVRARHETEHEKR